MDNLQERIQVIRECAKAKSDLQMQCLENLDLLIIKSNNDLGKARYNYENCMKENYQNFPSLVRLNKLINYGNLN